jgi:hypothetical protein
MSGASITAGVLGALRLFRATFTGASATAGAIAGYRGKWASFSGASKTANKIVAPGTNLYSDPSFEGVLGGTLNGVTRTTITSWLPDGSGGSGVRLTANGSTSDSFWAPLGDFGAIRAPFVAGREYVISAYVRLAPGLDANIAPDGRSVAIVPHYVDGGVTTEAPGRASKPLGTAGTPQRVWGYMAVPATATQALVRLYLGFNNVATPGAWVEWNGLVIEDVTGTGRRVPSPYGTSHLESSKVYGALLRSATVLDSIGERYSLVPGANPMPTISGGRLVYSTSDGALSLPGYVTPSTQFSFALRYRQDSTGYAFFVGNWGSGAYPGEHDLLMYYEAGIPALVVAWTDSAGGFHNSVWSAITLGVEHEIRVDYDGTTLRLFIDGVLVDSEVTTIRSAVTPKFQIGNWAIPGTSWSGYIEWAEVSNVSRRTANYTPVTPTADVNTKALFLFDSALVGSTSSGVLAAYRAKWASWSGATTTAGAVSATRRLSGTITGAALSSGSLATYIAKWAAISGASATAGTLAAARQLAATLSGASLTAGSVAASTVQAIIYAALSGAAATAGTLSSYRAKWASLSGASVSSGALAGIRLLAATLTGASATTGVLAAYRSKRAEFSGASLSGGVLAALRKLAASMSGGSKTGNTIVYPGGNGVTDPSFEGVLAGTTTGVTRTTVPSIAPDGGSVAVRLTTSSSSADNHWAPFGDLGGMRTPFVAGREYVVSCYVRVAPGLDAYIAPDGRAASVTVYYHRAGESGSTFYGGSSEKPRGTAGTPQRVWFYVSLPANTDQAFIRLYNGFGVAVTPGAYVEFDGLVVEDVTGTGRRVPSPYGLSHMDAVRAFRIAFGPGSILDDNGVRYSMSVGAPVVSGGRLVYTDDTGGVVVGGGNLAAQFSFAARYRQDSTGYALLGGIWGGAALDQAVLLYYEPTPGIAQLVWNDVGGVQRYINTPMTTGVEHEVRADYDGTTMRLFVDGVLSASMATTVRAAVNPDLRLGGWQYDVPLPFTGYMEWAEVSNVSRFTASYTPLSGPINDANTRAAFSFNTAIFGSLSGGTLTSVRLLAAAMAGASATAGNVAARRLLAAALAGATTSAGSLATLRLLQAALLGAASTGGDLAALRRLVATLSATSATDGNLAAARLLTSQLPGAASTAGEMAALRVLRASLTGSGTTDGTAAAVRLMPLLMAGAINSSGTVTALRVLQALLLGTADTEGQLAAIRVRYATLDGTGTTAGTLAAFRTLQAVLEGAASTDGALAAIILLATIIAIVQRIEVAALNQRTLVAALAQTLEIGTPHGSTDTAAPAQATGVATPGQSTTSYEAVGRNTP